MGSSDINPANERYITKNIVQAAFDILGMDVVVRVQPRDCDLYGVVEVSHRHRTIGGFPAAWLMGMTAADRRQFCQAIWSALSS